MTMGGKSSKVSDVETSRHGTPQPGEEDADARKQWLAKRASIHAEMPSAQIHNSAQGTTLARKAMTKVFNSMKAVAFMERAKKLTGSGAATDPSRRPQTAGGMELRLMQEVNKRGLKTDMDEDGDVDELDRLKQLDIVREMPVPLHWKRKMRERLNEMIPNYEGAGCSAWCYKRKVKAYLSKKKGKRQWDEVMQYLTLWGTAMTKVEGNHGSGVLTYFTFLRWLFLTNIIIFLSTFMFVVVPMVAFPATNYNTWVIANTSSSVITTVDTCSANYIANITIKSDAASLILNFVEGTGWMENTVMFQGYYVNKLVSITSTYGYNIPMAYLCAMMFYMLFSLILITRRTSTGFRDRLFTTASASRQYCNLVFAAWDYNVSKEDSAELRLKSTYRNIVGEMAEKRRQQKLKDRTTSDKCKLYSLRGVINVLILASLGGAFYLIYYTTIKTVELTGSTAYDSYHTVTKFLIQYMTSLTITTLNAILPTIYKLVVRFEDYSTGFTLNITLFRTVFLKLASLTFLLISIFSQITCATQDECRVGTGDCSAISDPLFGNSTIRIRCWETKIGQEIYKLVIMDFFVLVGVTFCVEFPRWIIGTKCSCKLAKKIPRKEFDVAKEVLTLIYGQTLLWLGTFYSPILPAVVVLKNFIGFYIKYMATMIFYGPSTKPFSSSDSDAFFMYALLIAYALCVVPIGYCIWMIPPSRGCGPFRLYDKIYDIMNLTISTWPTGLNSFFTFLQSTIFEITAIVVLLVLIYYLWQVITAYQSMITLLKEQLVLEKKDQRFLLEKVHELEGRPPAQNDLYKQNTIAEGTEDLALRPATPSTLTAPDVSIV